MTPERFERVKQLFLAACELEAQQRSAFLDQACESDAELRADDRKLRRPVALKFILQGRARDAAWLARFYDEARLSLAVTHRNVCRVYDLGEADGEAFLSMEYVDGEDLASLLRRVGRLVRREHRLCAHGAACPAGVRALCFRSARAVAATGDAAVTGRLAFLPRGLVRACLSNG